MCAQQIRFNKIYNVYFSLRTFLSEIAFFFLFKNMTVKNKRLFVQFVATAGFWSLHESSDHALGTTGLVPELSVELLNSL